MVAEKWTTYHDVQLWRVANSGVYFYVVDEMAVDADGAPNAYHPDDTGLDALANAGFPHGGWKSVLVADPEDPSRPYRQVEGEFAGYFVSMTTLQDQTRPATDIHRYVDSRLVPYLVFPGAFFALKGTGNFGDIGAALNLANGKESPVIVADKGPRDAPLREVSIRLAENLGGVNVNPRTGGGMPRGRFVYVLAPTSRSEPPWPASSVDLRTRSQALMASIGGWDAVRAAIDNP